MRRRDKRSLFRDANRMTPCLVGELQKCVRTQWVTKGSLSRILHRNPLKGQVNKWTFSNLVDQISGADGMSVQRGATMIRCVPFSTKTTVICRSFYYLWKQ